MRDEVEWAWIYVEANALWAGITKNTDWSTGTFAYPFAHSLAPLTRSLACSLRSLLRSWDSEFLMSQNDLVLSHSETVRQWDTVTDELDWAIELEVMKSFRHKMRSIFPRISAPIESHVIQFHIPDALLSNLIPKILFFKISTYAWWSDEQTDGRTDRHTI